MLLSCVLVQAALGLAQADSLRLRYASTITEADLRRHLEILASDSFEGRETAKPGQWKAADYLRDQFINMGADSLGSRTTSSDVEGFFQRFDLIESGRGTISVRNGAGQLELGQDLLYFTEVLDSSLQVKELIMADIHQADGLDWKGRDMLLNADSWGPGLSPTLLRDNLNMARQRHPRTITVLMEDFGALARMAHGEETRLSLAYEESRRKEPMPQVLLVRRAAFASLLSPKARKRLARLKAAQGIPVDLDLVVDRKSRQVESANVLAYIEGGDLKDEVLVLTAHYDHIGIQHGVVYNGADDDGTGTVALLEIAEAFMRAKQEGHGPRRSVLIMPVSGEEKGLLGSRYYSDHPAIPLSRTIANLNIDMIGRTDSAHADAAPYVYIIGSDRLSRDLHAANERANAHVGIELDYTFNAPDDPNRFYYRSDHYNFARKGIPSIFYFSGVHEDYHQPGDDVEKIRFDLLRARTNLVFHTAWELANAPTRPALDAAKP